MDIQTIRDAISYAGYNTASVLEEVLREVAITQTCQENHCGECIVCVAVEYVMGIDRHKHPVGLTLDE